MFRSYQEFEGQCSIKFEQVSHEDVGEVIVKLSPELENQYQAAAFRWRNALLETPSRAEFLTVLDYVGSGAMPAKMREQTMPQQIEYLIVQRREQLGGKEASMKQADAEYFKKVYGGKPLSLSKAERKVQEAQEQLAHEEEKIKQRQQNFAHFKDQLAKAESREAGIRAGHQAYKNASDDCIFTFKENFHDQYKVDKAVEYLIRANNLKQVFPEIEKLLQEAENETKSAREALNKFKQENTINETMEK